MFYMIEWKLFNCVESPFLSPILSGKRIKNSHTKSKKFSLAFQRIKEINYYEHINYLKWKSTNDPFTLITKGTRLRNNIQKNVYDHVSRNYTM